MTNIVIFGISGNLAQNKILPAIKEIKTDLNIIGFSRSKSKIQNGVKYIEGNYSDADDIKAISRILIKNQKTLYYFAVPQNVYKPLFIALSKSGLINKKTKTKDRILVEKPFGIGLRGARELDKTVKNYFNAQQILKVDHYGGKKEIINAKSLSPKEITKIKKIKIELIEADTVGHRGKFYDEVGALYDVGQNHLLYTLSTLLQGSKKDRNIILSKLKYQKKGSYFGQYEGYKKENNIPNTSQVETHFTIRAYIDDSKYDHIEIVLQSGKAHGQNKSQIQILDHTDHERTIAISSGKEAYKNIFLSALKDEREVFLSDKEVISSWKFIEKAKAHKMDSSLIKYKKGSLPKV